MTTVPAKNNTEKYTFFAFLLLKIATFTHLVESASRYISCRRYFTLFFQERASDENFLPRCELQRPIGRLENLKNASCTPIHMELSRDFQG